MVLVHPMGVPNHARCKEQLPGVGVIVTSEEGDDTQSLFEVGRNLKRLSMGVMPLRMREILIHLKW